MTTLPRSLPLPFSPFQTSPKLPLTSLKLPTKPLSLSTPLCRHHHRRLLLLHATENGAQTDSDADTPAAATPPDDADQLAEVGAEIRKAIKERETPAGGGEGFWDGVVEEIGMIEWPEFGKVVGTTVVVLGVIAGSSVVLLTLNAVLAEVSDQVFVGKGVQDFFAG
ncbi:hypothetical protein RND81_14G033800 [Saponaria officinalis]|uniref:Preprotein translocase subunit SECE1 n=1 Tax=Saponaria officinalis TaxID=3572 RepID=A0AAW1GMT6_SAPOF